MAKKRRVQNKNDMFPQVSGRCLGIKITATLFVDCSSIPDEDSQLFAFMKLLINIWKTALQSLVLLNSSLEILGKTHLIIHSLNNNLVLITKESQRAFRPSIPRLHLCNYHKYSFYL